MLDLSKAEAFRLALVKAGFWKRDDQRSPLNDGGAFQDLEDNLRAAGRQVQTKLRNEGEETLYTVSVGSGEPATSELYQIAFCQAVLNALGLTIK